MSRATNDLNAVRMMIGPAVMYSANTAIVFVVGHRADAVDRRAADAHRAHPAAVRVGRRSSSSAAAIHKRFERIQAQLSDLSAVVQEALSGVRVVRAYRQEDAEIERFRRANQEYLDRNRVLIRLQGLFYPSMSLFLGLGRAAGALARQPARSSAAASRSASFVAFNAYLVMLSWPMIAFGWVTNMLQRGMASWKRMLEVLDAVPAITDAEARPCRRARRRSRARSSSAT